MLMDPGTGKTKAALDTVGMLAQAGKVQRVFVVCPLSALAVWEDQIEEHYPHRAVSKNCLEEAILYSGNELSKNTVFWLMNYDLFRQRQRVGGKWVYPYVRMVERWAPDVVVLDESHRAKRAGSVTATALWRSVQRMRRKKQVRVYLLTGTPNPKGYIDIFSQYRVMDPEIFGTSKAGFEDRYCQYGSTPYTKFRIVRYLNTHELTTKVRDHAHIANESVLDLPPRLFQNVRIKLPPVPQNHYDDLVTEYLTTLETGEDIEASNAAVVRLRLQQVTGGYTTEGVPIHGAKLQALGDILFDLREQGENGVVYARFLPEVQAIHEMATDLGYGSTAITGKVRERDRARAIREFQSSHASVPTGKPRLLVFQVQTGSLAITLTAANEVVFYSLPDGWDTYYQCIKRVHRAGQHRACRIRHLLCSDTVDVSQLSSLKHKSDWQAELMQNPAGYLWGETTRI
jgi:SNF2 family DNA or RNA helicase